MILMSRWSGNDAVLQSFGSAPARPILLVLRHHGLGDLVTGQPALRGLRRRFPNHSLVTTCPSWLLSLARHFGAADTFVSEISRRSPISWPTTDPSTHQCVDATLLANVLDEVPRPEIVVSLRTPGPELSRVLDILRPTLCVSYRYAPLEVTRGFPELNFSDHILTRWKRLLELIDVEVDNSHFYAKLISPLSNCGHTVVHVGAGSPARLWPQERWAEVVRHLDSKGHQVVLTGSRGEAGRVAQVHRTAGIHSVRDLSGDADIMNLARLVAGARLVVSVDTGISHLATAFKRPALTLFGPIPPAWWGPPPGNPQHRTLWTGKVGDTYAPEVDTGLMEISVACVLDTI